MFVSAFDLFRIGLGPSSAHTTGPMRAARRFVHELEADGVFFQTRRISVDLYGSVACTGRDQGTDRAILSGLSGDAPDAIDPRNAHRARGAHPTPRASSRSTAHRGSLSIRAPTSSSTSTRRSPTTTTRCASPRATRAARRSRPASISRPATARSSPTAKRSGPRSALRVPYPFATAAELLAHGQSHGKKVAEMVRTNELALRSPDEVRAGPAAVRGDDAQRGRARPRDRWHAAGRRGPAAARRDAGGGDRGHRSRARLHGPRCSRPPWPKRTPPAAASSRRLRTARRVRWPRCCTSGARRRRSPATMARSRSCSRAAAVGQLLRASGFKHVGCQGEVGVASAMAAAGLAAVNNASNRQVLYAAERALEPFIGLTCDPVGRARAGSVHRAQRRGRRACSRAQRGSRCANRIRPVALDAAIRTMIETGRAMTGRYKEASLGGLAVNVVDC